MFYFTMEFSHFLEHASKIQNVALPAALAHAKMAPSNRMDLLRKMNPESNSPKKAAVMMLFYPKENKAHLVLIVRAFYKGVHSSQIAFPGGKPEMIDFDLKETALRETEEEIGISAHKIEVIRPFTELYIPPSNYLVHPYLGISKEELSFTRQESEVAAIVELPLLDFLSESIVQSQKIETSYASNLEVPGFLVKEHFVWGATAMMLSELKETIKMVF